MDYLRVCGVFMGLFQLFGSAAKQLGSTDMAAAATGLLIAGLVTFAMALANSGIKWMRGNKAANPVDVARLDAFCNMTNAKAY